MPFIDTWNYIQKNLKNGTTINNWTKDKQYLGDQFTIYNVASTQVAIDTPGATNIQYVPQNDFEDVYNIWQQYVSSTHRRYQIRDNTHFSKYIISILKWVENSNGEILP